LAADAEADEPLGDVVPAPARPPLGTRANAAEAGPLPHQPARREEALGAPASVEREGDHRAEALHLARCHLVRGVARQSRIANVEDVRSKQQALGERQRSLALAVEP